MGEVVWYLGIYVSTHPGVAPTESKCTWCLHRLLGRWNQTEAAVVKSTGLWTAQTTVQMAEALSVCRCFRYRLCRVRDFSSGVPTLWRAPARGGQEDGCKFSIPVIQTSLFLAGSRDHFGKAPLSEKSICSE